MRDSLLEQSTEARHGIAAAAQIRQALRDILESQPFRTSRQCRDLFRYIVEHSLSGQEGDLRERVLGVEVFGRAPDYDTGEDPVVRMRAADVRKRLAQFYQAADHQTLHIELKPGSYRAAFRFAPAVETRVPFKEARHALEDVPLEAADAVQELAQPVLAPRSNIRSKALFLGAGGLIFLLIMGFGLRSWVIRTKSVQVRFWAPVLQPKQPVLVYLGSNVAYRFSPDYMTRYQTEHGMASQNGPEFFPELHRGETIRSDDLLPVKNTFITTGDLAASVQVTSLLSTWSRPFVMRSAGDLSISDLRDTPAIFVGGFNNSWTLATTAELPLAFRNGVSIVESAHPEHHWSIDPNDHKDTTVDYALVSRVLRSSTGGPALILGGIGSYGTQAAAEFVCSPEKLNQLLHDAPPGWEARNMQAVLRIQVVGYAPVSIRVVKTAFW